jgi:hypothetical protein
MPTKKKVKVSSFESRFNIPIDLEKSKSTFVNRVRNTIWNNLSYEEDGINRHDAILWSIANGFGEEYSSFYDFDECIGVSFLRNLKALEITYTVFTTEEKRLELQQGIEYCLSNSEIDIGIKWHNGIFIKSGAKELDEELVNKVMEWIDDEKYKTVKIPFVRGIQSLIEAVNNEGRRRDVIRDMYESLEALSMIITGKTKKELSGNMEKYLAIAGVSNEYRCILREYIVYGNRIRHATGKNDEILKISYKEVESFVYLTGVFIRISI